MNYSAIDFIEVRRLVLEYETELDSQRRLDDSDLFRASNEVHRAMLAICSFRERAMVISELLSLAPHLGEKCQQQFEKGGSIWFDEAIFPELLALIPMAVAYCPDLFVPEILVPALLTVRFGGSLLKACFGFIPLLRKECLEILVDFILKCTQIGLVGTCYRPSDPLLFHCFEHSYCLMESLCQSDSWMASILRETLVQRCIGANIIIYITVEVLKDVLDFTTKVLFSNEETCWWIISCIKSRKNAAEICKSSAEVEKFPKVKGTLTPIHWPNSLQLEEATVSQLRKALHVDAKAAIHADGWTGNLFCHLKVYCILVNLGGLQPIEEEVVFWLRALTCTLESSRANAKDLSRKHCICKRRFELGVAFLFLVPGFRSSSVTDNLFRECVLSFLGPAISGLVPFEQGPEIALWLVIQLFFRCYAQVSEYCSKAIGMNVKIDSTCWEDVCCIAYETGITSDIQGITNAASSLRSSGSISSTKCNQFVIDCLFQLLKSGHFVRSRVNMTDSIMHCILLSVEPIHLILVRMIEMFVKASSTTTATNADAYVMQPLPYGFLASAIKPFCSILNILDSTSREERVGVPSLCGSTDQRSHSSCSIKTDIAAQAVLVSFYILYREQFRRSQGTFLGSSNDLNGRNDEEISRSNFLRYLPLDKLHAHMESHLNLYEHIFPQWVGLAISVFPERMHASHLIQRLGGAEGDFDGAQETFCTFEEHVEAHDEDLQHILQNKGNGEVFDNFSENFSIGLAHHIFRNSSTNCVPTLKLLKTIHTNKFSARDKLELQITIIEDMLPLLLDKSCSETLHEAFCEWWYSLDQTSLEFLVPFFCRCITTSYMDTDERSSFMYEDGFSLASNLYQEFVEQPLSILTCGAEIYHTPVLSIFLDALRGLLVTNRHMCVLASSNDGELKKEETIKAVDIRDSAVCQVLLENWSRMFSLGVSTVSIQRAGSLICAFLSSLFCSHPSVLRVVHFQGYDMKLVPAVASSITMMVHFLDFFEDSLKLIELSKVPFMIVLLSNIIRRFHNHSRSSSAAQKVLMYMKSLDMEAVINFLEETLEAVAWFGVAFPSLKAEVRDFLEGWLRATSSGDISSTPNAIKLHSSVVSALALLSKNGGSVT